MKFFLNCGEEFFFCERERETEKKDSCMYTVYFEIVYCINILIGYFVDGHCHIIYVFEFFFNSGEVFFL